MHAVARMNDAAITGAAPMSAASVIMITSIVTRPSPAAVSHPRAIFYFALMQFCQKGHGAQQHRRCFMVRMKPISHKIGQRTFFELPLFSAPSPFLSNDQMLATPVHSHAQHACR